MNIIEPTNIKETLELADFVVKLTNGIHASLGDNKINWKDSLHLAPAAFALPRALAGVEKIPGELKNMGQDSREYLLQFLYENLEAVTADDKAIALQIFEAQAKAIQLAIQLFRKRQKA